MSALQHYKNFTISKQVADEELGVPILYHEDEEGRDWYELQQTFRNDTYKVGYSQDGIVRTISKDVWAIAPTGLSIIEVKSIPDVSEDELINGWYEVFNDEVIFRIPPQDEIDAAERERKQQLIDEVSQEIAILSDAVDLDMATDEEKSRLTELKRYRINLSRMTEGSHEVWPIKP
ncbi:tail fiber assembly protein [Yersinia enterocolitica]|nr:tail fiber assembly protein [Yersinia enterocolitica]HEI6775437.1 tail fiber assembly protein [Yersinia enterocolitica]HEI6777316.1 tail fiber assembly protein [Yersinia enterocolitica]HEI6785817.1 tail fiber assembly protein [Yersinia enterocolitica]HEI6838439.1 tail fiber assembly protein [Yersinia enterocolitica]